jgi:hypothetical protein
MPVDAASIPFMDFGMAFLWTFFLLLSPFIKHHSHNIWRLIILCLLHQSTLLNHLTSFFFPLSPRTRNLEPWRSLRISLPLLPVFAHSSRHARLTSHYLNRGVLFLSFCHCHAFETDRKTNRPLSSFFFSLPFYVISTP